MVLALLQGLSRSRVTFFCTSLTFALQTPEPPFPSPTLSVFNHLPHAFPSTPPPFPALATTHRKRSMLAGPANPVLVSVQPTAPRRRSSSTFHGLQPFYSVTSAKIVFAMLHRTSQSAVVTSTCPNSRSDALTPQVSAMSFLTPAECLHAARHLTVVPN